MGTHLHNRSSLLPRPLPRRNDRSSPRSSCRCHFAFLRGLSDPQPSSCTHNRACRQTATSAPRIQVSGGSKSVPQSRPSAKWVVSSILQQTEGAFTLAAQHPRGELQCRRCALRLRTLGDQTPGPGTPKRLALAGYRQGLAPRTPVLRGHASSFQRLVLIPLTPAGYSQEGCSYVFLGH